MLVREVDAKTIHSVWPETLSHGYGQSHRQKRVGKPFIFYSGLCPELMAMFLKMKLAFQVIRKWHTP